MDLLSFTLNCHQTGYVQSHAKEQQSQRSCEVTLQNNEKLLLSSTFSAFTVCGRLKKTTSKKSSSTEVSMSLYSCGLMGLLLMNTVCGHRCKL